MPNFSQEKLIHCKATLLKHNFQVSRFLDESIKTEELVTIAFGDKLKSLTMNTYKVHGGAFQPAAHLG